MSLRTYRAGDIELRPVVAFGRTLIPFPQLQAALAIKHAASFASYLALAQIPARERTWTENLDQVGPASIEALTLDGARMLAFFAEGDVRSERRRAGWHLQEALRQVHSPGVTHEPSGQAA